MKQIDAGRAQPFADLGQAADYLAAVLAEGPRRLVVLDDVWFEEQLSAFPVAGRGSPAGPYAGARGNAGADPRRGPVPWRPPPVRLSPCRCRPHPNPMHANWGRRLQRYDVDPATAATVRRIFAERLRGSSVSRIAAMLNADGVPCPSQADPGRNRHRDRMRMGSDDRARDPDKREYTGRQVWNRQPAHHTPAHLPGPFKTQRWAGTSEWVISTRVAHPPLVSEADFIAAQEITALPSPVGGGVRRYQLVGLLRCGRCRRRLESSWSHGRAAYRCQHGHTSARPGGSTRMRNTYVREDRIIVEIRILLQEEHPELEDQPVWRIARHLREQGLVVTCAEAACTIEAEVPN